MSNFLDKFAVKRQSYVPAVYDVEGDWSSASYFLALGAMLGGVELDNVNSSSWQGDRVMMELIRQMGAKVDVEGGSIMAGRTDLNGTRADLNDSIDLLPTMAVLASVAKGESVFTGIRRARAKESDRVSAVKEGLERMGIKVDVDDDSMTITGGEPAGAEIDSKGDHRIAMAFGVLGALAGGVVIDGAECVSKTYPAFWEDLKRIGGNVDVQ